MHPDMLMFSSEKHINTQTAALYYGNVGIELGAKPKYR